MNYNGRPTDYYGRFQNGAPVQRESYGSRQHQQYSSSYHRNGRSYSAEAPPNLGYGIPRPTQYVNNGYQGSRSSIGIDHNRAAKGIVQKESPPAPDIRHNNTLPAKLPPGELIIADERPDGAVVYPVYTTEQVVKRKVKAAKWDPEKVATEKVIKWKWVEWLGIAQIAMGLCLIALGILRLALRTVAGRGIELVFGFFVLIIGIVGLVAARRKHYCLLVSFFTMSVVAVVLSIAPIIAGLLVALPSSNVQTPNEPLGLDFVVVAVSILEMGLAIFCSVVGCLMLGTLLKNWAGKRTSEFLASQPPPNPIPTIKVSPQPK